MGRKWAEIIITSSITINHYRSTVRSQSSVPSTGGGFGVTGGPELATLLLDVPLQEVLIGDAPPAVSQVCI